MENNLENPARRSFLKTGAAALATTAASASRVLGANDRIRVAVVGLRGRGWDHVRGYKPIPGVEVAYFCDVDRKRSGQALRGRRENGDQRSRRPTPISAS